MEGESSSAVDPYDFVYDDLPQTYRTLREQNDCRYYGAKRFQYEGPSFCCIRGKVQLAEPQVPDDLYHLFTTQNAF